MQHCNVCSPGVATFAIYLMIIFCLGEAGWSEGRGEEDAGEGIPLLQQRCLPHPVVGGSGSVVVYDIVLNLRMDLLYIIGPHKKLWIVPDSPDIPSPVGWRNTFASAFEYSWLPDNNETASICTFTHGSGEHPAFISHLRFMGDVHEHVNLAACPPPPWLPSTGGHIGVHVSLTMRPLTAQMAKACAMDGQRGEYCKVKVGQEVEVGGMEVCLPTPVEEVELSLCCMIKNEGAYLREWIEYGLMIGVARFYLYDHGSSDFTEEVLRPYIHRGIVVLHDWRLPGYPQKEAHTHCTHRYSHQTQWMGLMDVDEFLVPGRGSTSILPLLREAVNREGGGGEILRIVSAMFGSSGYTSPPTGPVTGSYFERAYHSVETDQRKVLFQTLEAQVLLPGIHEILAVKNSQIRHLDVHPHDLYYNHYRVKSKEDQRKDPLRSHHHVDAHFNDTRLWNRFGTSLVASLARSAAEEVGDVAEVEGGHVTGGLLYATEMRRKYAYEPQCYALADLIFERLNSGAAQGNTPVSEIGSLTGFYSEEIESKGSISVTRRDVNGRKIVANGSRLIEGDDGWGGGGGDTFTVLPLWGEEELDKSGGWAGFLAVVMELTGGLAYIAWPSTASGPSLLLGGTWLPQSFAESRMKEGGFCLDVMTSRSMTGKSLSFTCKVDLSGPHSSQRTEPTRRKPPQDVGIQLLVFRPCVS